MHAANAVTAGVTGNLVAHAVISLLTEGKPMLATWVQIAELVLLPLGLGIGYTAGRTRGHDEYVSFHAADTITHPGLAEEYPAHLPHLTNTPPSRASWAASARRGTP